MAGGALIGVAALAFVGRKLFWQAIAISADAVEEIADTIEDAAEDLSDAARARADGRESGSD